MILAIAHIQLSSAYLGQWQSVGNEKEIKCKSQKLGEISIFSGW